MRHTTIGTMLTTVLGLALVAGACSAAGDAAVAPSSIAPATTTSTTVKPTTTVARTTTTTSTTTTVAPTTTEPPTTTTTLPPTTTVPPTTLPPVPTLYPAAAPLAPTRTGSRGPAVAALQQRLLDLGFWLDGVDSRYGLATSQAVMAFQKHFGLKADGIAGTGTVEFMSQPLPRAEGRSTTGDLIEVSKGRQVLYVVRSGKTLWAFNTSTGSGKDYEEFSEKNQRPISGSAITPEGRFTVQREKPDGWWEGDLGDLYRPKYFRGGVAVHGSNRIPNYPASHGCVRVSLPAMDFIWAQNLMPLKSVVVVRPD